MRNRKLKRFLEKKAFLLVLLLCAVSALGMYGVYRMELGDNHEQNESFSDGLVDLNEMTTEQELALRQPKETAAKPEELDNRVSEETEEGSKTTAEEDEALHSAEMKDEESEETAQVMAQSSGLSFSQSETVKWPVKGNIILDYSPENTVYFATLEQYRCNPAVLIQAQAGTPVAACTDGKVKEITSSDELGTTLVLDLGNGYEAVYGQLSGVTTASGATVAAGDTLAVVAAPTKYYVVEGSHVYFQMLKDGTPVNPRAFLE